MALCRKLRGICLCVGLVTNCMIGVSQTIEQKADRGLPLTEDFRGHRLGGKASILRGWSYVCGNIKIAITQGTATPILVHDEVCGYYLKGEGRFTYTVTNSANLAVASFNLKENTRLKPQSLMEGLRVEEPLSEAVLWLFGGAPLLLPSGTMNVPVEDFKQARTTFALRDNALAFCPTGQFGILPLDQLYAYRAINCPKLPTVVAELTGAHGLYLFSHDPARSRTQSMWCLQSVEWNFGRSERGLGRAYLPAVALDLSPIGATHKNPIDPDVKLFHVDMDMEANRKTYAHYTVTESYRVLRSDTQLLSLRLESAPTIAGKERPQGPRIKKALLDGRTPVAFDQGAGFLLVDLGRPYRNGETTVLTFEAEGDFLLGSNLGDQCWRLIPGSGWFPEPDTAGQAYTIKARIAVEKPYVAIASGETVRRSETLTHSVVEVALNKPTLWFSVAAGKYEPRELVKNGLTIRAWGYAGIGKGADQLLKTAHGIMSYYKFLLGDLPFSEVNLVEYPEVGFGQAPAGMIWLTREAFDSIFDDLNKAVASSGVGGWVNRMLAHEIAHQYWAHQVKMWGQEDQWLTESFAEYSSALAMRAMRRKGLAIYELIVKDYEISAREASPFSSIAAANLLSPSRNGGRSNLYRKALVYDKGAYLLACLHGELGEEDFTRFLRVYQLNFGWKAPSISYDVADILKAITGKDYEPWLNRYFWGTEMPERKNPN